MIFLILDAIYQSSGAAIAVTDHEIQEAMGTLATHEGILACPEGAATVAGLSKLVETKEIQPENRVVLFNTGGYQA